MENNANDLVMDGNLGREIVRLIESGIKFSDIHLVENDVLRIRGGDVKISKVADGAIISRADILEFLDGPTKRKGLVIEDCFSAKDDIDVSCEMDIGGKKIRFRVNAFRARGKLEMVLRKIEDKIISVSDLGFGDAASRKIVELCGRSQGIIFVTGATGSGKTTTLGSMVNEINSSYECKIITIEDPIEVVHENKKAMISQREVGVDTSSFGGALRSALREDPDVIMIGEIRDRQTAETALDAALTGHLVLATMHTNDASQTIQRFVQMFDSEDRNRIQTILAAALVAVISQTLEKDVNNNRILISELMIASNAIKSSITNGQFVQIPNQIMESANTLGNYLMGRKAMELLVQHRITKEVAKKIFDLSSDSKSLNEQLLRIK